MLVQIQLGSDTCEYFEVLFGFATFGEEVEIRIPGRLFYVKKKSSKCLCCGLFLISLP